MLTAHVLRNAALLLVSATALAQSGPAPSWRYYRPGNTGIQGDYNEALWIGPDGDPWIGGYDASFEEGGVAKYVQAEDRWINVSNVDHPIIGHPDDTGTSRVSDIVGDASGRMWMATGRGALFLDPAIGPSSLLKYDPSNSTLPGGWTEDVDIAPDGSIWFAARSVFWGGGGIARYVPSTGVWTGWPALGDRLSAQPKPGGGYWVWNGDGYYGLIQRFDSATQTWTQMPSTGATGEILGLPGKDCTDDAGNFWALRATLPGEIPTLEYRRPDGVWIAPPMPYPGASNEVWVLRAFGDRQALIVDGGGGTWRFDGATWTSLGIWRPGPNSYAADIDSAGNVWVSGVGGAAKRSVSTGQWQRYRVTNTSQYDTFSQDVSVDPAGGVYACANAGPGVGGMVRFDGTRWIGFNNDQYGLGFPWPFPTDNSQAIHVRASNGKVAVHPTFNGVRQWDGSQFTTLETGSTVKDLVEDSLGRLWYVGEYYSLKVHDGTSWTQVGITAWGSKIRRDPDRPGTVWAATGHEVKRTDGVYSFSRGIGDFPELTTQSDTFSGLAPAPGGIVWVGASLQFGAGGSGGALIRIDANTGLYQMLRYDQGWPFPGQYVQPLAVTPDGRLWMQYDSDFLVAQRGLCWWDGTNVGVYPAPSGGEPQWGGLPHAAIADLDVRVIPGGYELWMSCISRGLAVLTVPTEPTGTVFCAGDSVAPHTACPCGNASPVREEAGCKNSFGVGATLRASGAASLAADTLVLAAAHLPATGVLFLQGTLAQSAGNGVVLGDGLRCVGGNLVRLKSTIASGVPGAATASYPVAGDLPVSVRGAIAAPGTYTYQAWYRDPAAYCASEAYNLSNGLSVVWGS